MPSQDEFLVKATGRCKYFTPKNGQHFIVNSDTQEEYDYYRNIKCVKGNVYADYCSYCAQGLCLYYDPESNLVPKGQAQTCILEPEEAIKYLANKKK
jgi:hypothetical protein